MGGLPTAEVDGPLYPPNYSISMKNKELSTNEIKTLKSLAHGFTLKEIASGMNYEYSTIRWYIMRIRQKLDAKTNTHAVAIAIRRGII